MKLKKTWEDCAAFHGHVCPGLTIGYKAALYAADIMELNFSDDEQVVCIAENDACGIDAIQVMLGCSIGKGNLLFRLRGKQAFSFYNRTTGKSVRLVLKPKPYEMDKAESFSYYQQLPCAEMFDVKPVPQPVPERARIFGSIACEICGEMTAEQMITLQGGKKLCPDCYPKYDRFGL